MNFTALKNQLSANSKNLYTEFMKYPTYYMGSAALRLAIGASVGYGMYYGLTALTAPYLAPLVASAQTGAMTNQLVAPMMQPFLSMLPNLQNVTTALPSLPNAIPSNISTVVNLVPKAIATLSALGGLLGATKLSNVMLSTLFGEVKLKLSLSKEGAKNAYLKNITFSGGILKIFGQNRPYVTPVSEISAQIETSFIKANKDNLELLKQSKTFALAYTKQLVENDNTAFKFDTEAKAMVNAEPYISAAKKAAL
jgi:hypothetical protein